MNNPTLFDLDAYSNETALTDWAVDVDASSLKVKKSRKPRQEKVSKDDSVTQTSVTESSVPSPPTPDSVTAVHPYLPKGKARSGHLYYCYTYRDGKRVRNIHIPGGNITSSLAQARAKEVEAAIEFGRSPLEIVKLIKSWSRRRHR